MRFLRTKYESDSVGIINVELSEDESAVAGTEPGGAAVSKMTAYASGSRRRNGIHTRGVLLSREVTDATGTATLSKFLTLRSASDLADTAYALGATVTIGGVAWTVSRQRDEVAV